MIISILFKKITDRYLIAVSLLLLPLYFFGQAEQHYSLFKPVPKEQMREMETDRPDVTESPYTVDAGHLQYETDVLRLIKDRSELKETTTLLVNQANIKLGLTQNTALQVGFQTYGRQKEKELNGENSVTEGFGDVTVRLKQNIIGNDKGNFVMALIPYVKFPTSQFEDSRFEGGLIVPMIYKLPGEWNLGFQVEVDRLKDKDLPEMHTELLQTLTLSHSLLKGMDGIAETYYTYDFKAHELTNYINAAVQVEVAKDFKLDAGINCGLQHHSEKHFFLGASYRH